MRKFKALLGGLLSALLISVAASPSCSANDPFGMLDVTYNPNPLVFCCDGAAPFSAQITVINNEFDEVSVEIQGVKITVVEGRSHTFDIEVDECADQTLSVSLEFRDVVEVFEKQTVSLLAGAEAVTLNYDHGSVAAGSAVDLRCLGGDFMDPGGDPADDCDCPELIHLHSPTLAVDGTDGFVTIEGQTGQTLDQARLQCGHGCVTKVQLANIAPDLSFPACVP